MSKKPMVLRMKLPNIYNTDQCRTCMLSKIHVAPFPKETKTTTKNLLDLIYSDMCSCFNINSLGGSKYFVTVIDDCSRMYLYTLLKPKAMYFKG